MKYNISSKLCRRLSRELGFNITSAQGRGGWGADLSATTGPSDEFPGYENVVWIKRKGKKIIAVEPGWIYSFMKDGQWFKAIGIVPEKSNRR